MTEIKIERRIPMPRQHTHYPFGSMKEGDSFAVPHKEAHRTRMAAYLHKRKYGGEFLTRTVEEDGVSVIRVWCVKAAPRR